MGSQIDEKTIGVEVRVGKLSTNVKLSILYETVVIVVRVEFKTFRT